MRKEVKKLPREMQEAYKNVPDRPTDNMPECIMAFLDSDEKKFLQVFSNPFHINEIVDFADDRLLDMDLDEKSGNDGIYNDFALEVVRKIIGLTDVETQKSKSLDFYDNNPKVTKLRARDFSKIGNLTDKSNAEKANTYAEFYGVQDDDGFKNLTEWERRLFVDKVGSRQDTSLEKK